MINFNSQLEYNHIHITSFKLIFPSIHIRVQLNISFSNISQHCIASINRKSLNEIFNECRRPFKDQSL